MSLFYININKKPPLKFQTKVINIKIDMFINKIMLVKLILKENSNGKDEIVFFKHASSKIIFNKN
jgi:hypothetical protein